MSRTASSCPASPAAPSSSDPRATREGSTGIAAITYARTTKTFNDGTRAVDAVDLAVGDGEFVTLVGPSGCGKTTLLRMTAGLEVISEGTITIGDRIVNDLPPRDRDVAMVFQNYALYPHMSVAENIAFPLRTAKMPKAEIAERLERAARMLGLTEYLRRRPKTLSGGQRQRVAMGRAIVREPQAFLMDEPLSNLDAKLRVDMRGEIIRLQRELGVTTMYVTHDQLEAMTMGHRVAVMHDGALQQVAPPEVVYDRPANLFVASFIGSPAMNIVLGELGGEDGSLVVTVGPHQLAIPAELAAQRPRLLGYRGRPIAVGLRPEHFRWADDGALKITVVLRELIGPSVLVHFDLGAPRLETADVAAGADDDAPLATRRLAVASLDPDRPTRTGDRVRLHFPAEKLHFFDPDTGVSLAGDSTIPPAAATVNVARVPA